jgi:hypothetical protein
MLVTKLNHIFTIVIAAAACVTMTLPANAQSTAAPRP